MGQRIGVIGLGHVGMPMVKNLVAAGFEVFGYRRGSMLEFKELGGIPATSPADIATNCSVIISCLPDANALDDVVSGPNGLLSGDMNGRVFIELSTLGLSSKIPCCDAIIAAGGQMIDGAISGLPMMVAARSAPIFISGDEDTCKNIKSVMDAITETPLYFGDFGNATRAKLSANMLVAYSIMGIAEALSFGIKAGVPAGKLVAALMNGPASSTQFKVRAPIMISGEWDKPMAPTSMLVKDLGLIEEMAADINCPIPMVETVAKLYRDAADAGLENKDVASVYSLISERAGIK